MKFVKHDRHGILVLSIAAILFVVVSIGCSKSNKSKIVGNWKDQSIASTDGSIHYVFFQFYKEGVVSKKTGTIINEQLSKPNIIVGKYKFEDDKNRITITWDDGKSETMKLSFPQESIMLLGIYKLEKIKG